MKIFGDGLEVDFENGHRFLTACQTEKGLFLVTVLNNSASTCIFSVIL